MIFTKIASILALLSTSSHAASVEEVAARKDKGAPKHLRGQEVDGSLSRRLSAQEHQRSLQDSMTPHTNQKCFAPNCELREGTYVTPGGNVARWWAFVPAGANACPEEGCPLFVGVGGTGQEYFDPPGLQMCMLEMVKRGFIGLTFEYANKFLEFGFCYGELVPSEAVDEMSSIIDGYDLPPFNATYGGSYSLVQKAQKVFDPTDEGSIIHQVCDGPEAFANCDLGIAVQGVSQGSLILGQATDVEKRISAALMWAVGDVVTIARNVLAFQESTEESVDKVFGDVDLPCMDSFQLPPPRMRLINGDSDEFFGRNAQGTIRQHKHMINNFYDCGDSYDCLTRDPSTVMDTYTGEEIPNEGGYFIVENSGHVDFMTTGLTEIPDETILPIFTNPAIYGGPASFDWLARTARIPYIPAQGSDFDKITMELDLDHYRLMYTDTDTGFFVEWADSNGALGPRTRVAEGVFQMSAEFSGEEVPSDTIGFRLHAAGNDGAFLDQLHVRTSGGDTFKGLSFGANRGAGWCISMDPNDTWWNAQCYGDQAFRCIDFCTNAPGDSVGVFHFCNSNEVSSCTSNDDYGMDNGSFCTLNAHCASGNCGFASWTCPMCCMEGLETDKKEFSSVN